MIYQDGQDALAGATHRPPTAVSVVRVTVANLFTDAGEMPPPAAADLFAIMPLVMKQFGHLPQPMNVTCDGDEVIIRHPVAAANRTNFPTPPASDN